ncbi:MAG TPA: regulatory protein RecX [Clostridiales bacterium]|nr:regulatory protein RecX [Clostridiales bacterium]
MNEVEIQEIKYGKKTADLTVDGQVYKKVSLEALVKCGISKGNLKADDFNKFLDLNEKLSARDSLFNTLARSSYKSEFGYRQKLKTKGFSKESIDYAIDFARQYGYIDDLKFATQFIETNKQKAGEFKLRYDLEKNRVPQDIIEKALSLADINEESSCYLVLEKYLKSKPLNFKTKQKAYSALASKGFSYESINAALDKFDFKIDEE